MKAIRFSTDANLDIEGIANYIFDLNPVAASRFLDALNETCELLAEHPLIGRLRPTLGEKPSFVSNRELFGFLPARFGRHRCRSRDIRRPRLAKTVLSYAE